VVELIGIALLVFSLVLGIAAGVLRGRESVRKELRLAPVVLFLLLELAPVTLAVLGVIKAARAMQGGDAATRATFLAGGISEAINCTIAVGVYAFVFCAGLIPALIVVGRSKRSVRTRPG
jgi:hypothetical protein